MSREDCLQTALNNRVQQVPLRLIDPPKLLLREIDQELIIDLAFSIKQFGVLQPILIRPKDDGRYEVVFGNHRYEAAKRVNLPVIPAIVRTLSDREALILALAENTQRLEMNPVKEGEIFIRLLNNNFDMASIIALSKDIGKCVDYIKKRISICQNLNPLLRSQIGKSLTITNAEMLSKQPKEQQEEIYRKVQEAKTRLGNQKSRELFSPEPVNADKTPTVAYCVCSQCGTKHIQGIKGMR